jgi:bacteriocin-like protein
MTQFETLTDAELTQVTGGVDITLSFDNEGIRLEGPLGKISLPNPFSLVGKAVSGTLGAAGELLSKLGGALTSAGQLFDFG